MTTSSNCWDAAEVLEIHDISRCVGWAPSQRRKCRNPIAGHNQCYGKEILEKLGKSDLDAPTIEQDLIKLAPTILCRRNHQNQASTMINKWLCAIEDLKEEREDEREAERERERQQQRQRAASLRVSQRRSSPLLLPQPQLLIPTRPPTPPTTEIELESPIARFSFGAPTRRLPSPPPTPTRQSRNSSPASITSPSSHTRSTRRDTSASPPQATSTTSASSTEEPTIQAPPTPSTSPAPQSSQPSSPLPLHPATPPADSTPTPPPPTLAIEDCAICFEPMPPHTAIASTCGHAFHANCINGAHAYQDSRETPQPHTCPYCRSPWLRRKVAGDCSICCQSLLSEDEEDQAEQSEGEGEGGEAGGNGEGPSPVRNIEEEEEGHGLVWCELQCGKNFHARCMRLWLAAAGELGASRRCPDCRADWVGS